MKDKNGVEINVGDIVEYRNPDAPFTTGNVTEVLHDSLKAFWEDTKKVELVYTSEFVEVIKPAASIPAEQTVGFTQEDEAMLQMLLKRKQEHWNKISSIRDSFAQALYGIDQIPIAKLFEFFKDKQNATKFCDTIKAFHEIN